jgi:hypothetical protein
MNVVAPKRLVVGADKIIMLDNFSLIVVAWRLGRLFAKWRGAHRLCARMAGTIKVLQQAEDTSKTVEGSPKNRTSVTC